MMRPTLLSLAIFFGLTTGCAHQQLTNRQVAKGAYVAGGVLLIVAILATQCNNCNLEQRPNSAP